MSDENSVEGSPYFGASHGVLEVHEEPRRAARAARRRRQIRRRRIVLGSILGLFVLGGLYLWNAVDPFGGPGAARVIVVAGGESTGSVISAMAKAGIISSPTLYRLDLLVEGAPLIQPGAYQFHQSSGFSTVTDILRGGPNVTEILVRPGNTLQEVAAQLGSSLNNQLPASFSADFVKAGLDGSVTSPFQEHRRESLEGLIAPGTYVVPPSMSARALLQEMVDTFTTEAAAHGLKPSTVIEGHRASDLVTIASIVEKEGYYTVNMPKVARVIYNRLAVHSVLQMDSTVLYALGRDGGVVTHAMLRNPTPYNTYLHAGLTPTPICAFSVAALQATLNPPPGPWRYFTLVDKAGHLAFATTFAEQLRNEAIAARNGI
jgi:UPF0755 protein